MITNKLPDEVIIGERVFPIHTDFRNGIRFSSALSDLQLEPGEAVAIGIALFFGNEPYLFAHYQEAAEKALYYYACGKVPNKNAQNSAIQHPLFDFIQDEDYIWAEFRLHGIDLETERMHWWKFCALFERLSTGTSYSKIIQFRSADTRGMEPKTARYYKQCKTVYALNHDACVKRPSNLKTRNDEIKRYVAKRLNDAEQSRSP